MGFYNKFYFTLYYQITVILTYDQCKNYYWDI